MNFKVLRIKGLKIKKIYKNTKENVYYSKVKWYALQNDIWHEVVSQRIYPERFSHIK